MPKPALQKDQQACRVRENKRRHRARHREYVVDLERRVARAREQGIQATIQMQLAAQRVAHENVGLRSLLRELAISDTTIEAWVSRDISGDRKHCSPCSGAQMEKLAQPLALSNQQEAERAEVNSKNIDRVESSSGTRRERQHSRPQESSASPVESSMLNKETPKKICARGCKEQSPQSQDQNQNQNLGTPPCRQLVLSAETACTRAPQVLPSSRLGNGSDGGSELEPDGSDGVECATAYKMLMQYATSQDKMDRIAAALDYGCTPSGVGGCKVKTNVMWKVLDEEC